MKPPPLRVPTGDYIREPAFFAGKPSFVPFPFKKYKHEVNTHSLMKQAVQPFHQDQALTLLHVSRHRSSNPYGNFTKHGCVPYFDERPKILSTRIHRTYEK